MAVWYWHEEWSDYLDSDHAEIEHFIAKRMQQEILTFKDPKGILDMRQVRLVLGEGTDKYQIGVAEIQPVPEGDTKVVLTITNENIAKMLGGNRLEGVIPQHVAPLTEEEETNG